MTRRLHRWTDEDAAFCAAQWASGIKQREIGAIFGYNNGSKVCSQIEVFIWKYAGLGSDLYQPQYQGSGRKELVKNALATFVAKRQLEDV